MVTTDRGAGFYLAGPCGRWRPEPVKQNANPLGSGRALGAGVEEIQSPTTAGWDHLGWCGPGVRTVGLVSASRRRAVPRPVVARLNSPGGSFTSTTLRLAVPVREQDFARATVCPVTPGGQRLTTQARSSHVEYFPLVRSERCQECHASKLLRRCSSGDGSHGPLSLEFAQEAHDARRLDRSCLAQSAS